MLIYTLLGLVMRCKIQSLNKIVFLIFIILIFIKFSVMVYKKLLTIALKISNDLIVFLTFSFQKSRPGPSSPYIHFLWGSRRIVWGYWSSFSCNCSLVQIFSRRLSPYKKQTKRKINNKFGSN